MMQMTPVGDVNLHVRIDGPEDGAPVVFINSLGTDMRLWDPILPLLPLGLRILRADKRGHGLSDCPERPYKMGTLVSDMETLMEVHGFKDALVVGLSIGGLIAQGLAVKRLDLVRALVLSNTGARIGNSDLWADRIAQVQASGTEALADGTMARWFSKEFQADPRLKLWRNMFTQQKREGYAGCSAAIAGADFYATTATLRLPALGIAGSEDGATPPDLMRETMDLIPGSQFHLIRRAGHLPCVEQPQEYADTLVDFMRATGHI